MSFRDDSNQQRDDILAWFRTTPGLIFSVAIIALFAGWFGVQFVIDLISQGAAG